MTSGWRRQRHSARRTHGRHEPQRKQNTQWRLIRRGTQDKTVVVFEHDMRVVFDLADTITVLVYGRVDRSGSPAEIRASEAGRSHLGKMGA